METLRKTTKHTRKCSAETYVLLQTGKLQTLIQTTEELWRVPAMGCIQWMLLGSFIFTHLLMFVAYAEMGLSPPRSGIKGHIKSLIHF
jgi:hypothetical protein